jgi:hypothetical protein
VRRGQSRHDRGPRRVGSLPSRGHRGQRPSRVVIVPAPARSASPPSRVLAPGPSSASRQPSIGTLSLLATRQQEAGLATRRRATREPAAARRQFLSSLAARATAALWNGLSTTPHPAAARCGMISRTIPRSSPETPPVERTPDVPRRSLSEASGLPTGLSPAVWVPCPRGAPALAGRRGHGSHRHMATQSSGHGTLCSRGGT